MWREGRYRPQAKSSLLTNYHLLRFRYSGVDQVEAEPPSLVEGRPFALLIIQAVSRHLSQLRIDFEASIPRGKRELNCDEFVAFLSHYLAHREAQTCPPFAPANRFAEELARQQQQQQQSHRASLFDSPLGLLHRLHQTPQAEDGPSSSSSRETPPPANLAAPQQPEHLDGESVDDVAVTHLPAGDASLLPPEERTHVRSETVDAEKDIALQTLDRMESTDPRVLRDQLVRLYRAIDVEDTDGVCWSEFSNFVSDTVMQASSSDSGGRGDGMSSPRGGGGAGGGVVEEAPYELSPFVCDRVTHINSILSVKGVKLGRNSSTGESEGFWLVQSRVTAEASGTSQDTRGGAKGAQSNVGVGDGGNFKCISEFHVTRKPQNPTGNLFASKADFITTTFEENIVQMEWIPLPEVLHEEEEEGEGATSSSALTRRSDSPSTPVSPSRRGNGHDGGGVDTDGNAIATVGLLAYSSTDLRLRLCEYRLQTGSFTHLGTVAASESFVCMSWSPYWRRLFCATNTGTMSVWNVFHPTVLEKRMRRQGRERDGRLQCFERTHQFSEHKSTICKILFLPLDGSVASASLDPRLIVQDFESQAVVADLKGAQAGIRDISYQQDYHMIAACGFEPHIRLWVLHESTRGSPIALHDRGTTGETSAQHTLPIIGVHFIPSTPYLASADSSGLMRIWDLRTLRVVQNVDLGIRSYPGHPRDKSIQQLSVMGESEMLLTSRRYSFLVHGLQESTATHLRSEAETLVAMGYSFSASTVVTCTASTLQLWDLRTGALHSTFTTGVSTKEEEATALALDTQGRKILVGFRGGKVRVYSSVNGALLKLVYINRNTGVEVTDLRTLPLGGLAIACDSTGSVVCFSDREEGVQFAYLEACGFQGSPALFSTASKTFPFLAIAHSKMLLTVYEVSSHCGLAPSFHSSLTLTSSASSQGTADRIEEESGLDPKTQLPKTRMATRRFAVSESAMSVAQSIDLVAMEYCDAWRSLVCLDSSGELHVCQIAPVKERAMRCTHRILLSQPSRGTSPVVSPVLGAEQHRKFSLGVSGSLASRQWVATCMQAVTVGGRTLVLLVQRRGEVVALELSRFPPLHRRIRFVYEPGALWACSTMQSSSSRDNSVTSRSVTPNESPRYAESVASAATTMDEEFDWADEVSGVVVHHGYHFAEGLARLPKSAGIDRGPLTSVLAVPALGCICCLPSGSRSVSVTTMDGDLFVGELSLDKRSSATIGNGTRSNSPQRSPLEGGYLGTTLDPLSIQHCMSEKWPADGDDDSGVEITVESLLALRPLTTSRSGPPLSSRRSNTTTPRFAALHRRRAQQGPSSSPPRGNFHGDMRALPPTGLSPRTGGEGGTSPSFPSSPSHWQSGRTATTFLQTRSSKKSAVQHTAMACGAVRRLLHANALPTIRLLDAPPGASVTVQHVPTTSSPAQAQTAVVATRSISSPSPVSLYGRRMGDHRGDPAMGQANALTDKQRGVTNILVATHPLVVAYEKLHHAAKLTVQTLDDSPSDRPVVDTTMSPSVTLSIPRATTPAPVTHGLRTASLTTAGWRSASVELRPVSGAMRVLPSLPRPHVAPRCSVTPQKEKDPRCVAIPIGRSPQPQGAQNIVVDTLRR